MLSTPTRLSGLLALVVILALAANAALYFHMATRLDALETNLQTRTASTQSSMPSSDGSTAGYSAALANSHRSQGTAAKLTPEELVQRLSQRNGGDPARVTADMNRLMQQEPSLPELESQQSRWLESTFSTMPANESRPSSIQSSCRGRRCLVSATFSDASDAQDWAGNYLLAAGGKMLQRSRTIVVPATNGSTRLLLYFY